MKKRKFLGVYHYPPYSASLPATMNDFSHPEDGEKREIKGKSKETKPKTSLYAKFPLFLCDFTIAIENFAA